MRKYLKGLAVLLIVTVGLGIAHAAWANRVLLTGTCDQIKVVDGGDHFPLHVGHVYVFNADGTYTVAPGTYHWVFLRDHGAQGVITVPACPPPTTTTVQPTTTTTTVEPTTTTTTEPTTTTTTEPTTTTTEPPTTSTTIGTPVTVATSTTSPCDQFARGVSPGDPRPGAAQCGGQQASRPAPVVVAQPPFTG